MAETAVPTCPPRAEKLRERRRLKKNNMKLKKLNEDRIALTNDMMSNIVGGLKYGDTRLTYSGGGASDFGNPSTDRVTQIYVNDGFGGGYWSNGNGCYHLDPGDDPNTVPN